MGYVVAITSLSDCILMTPEFIARQSQNELAVGLWDSGRYAWKLDNVQPLYPPIPATGHQGFWEWDAPPELEMKSVQLSLF
ncbi:MAG: hypothetical protein NVS2B14_19300 [Chamaesiphon sp.]